MEKKYRRQNNASTDSESTPEIDLNCYILLQNKQKNI